MKTPFLLLLVSAGLLACKKDNPTNQVEALISQPFTLGTQQTATLPAGSTPISVTLKIINDSRCPAGTQCIWAGYAAVEVALADASASVQQARISLGPKDIPGYATDSVRVTLNQRPYSLQLLGVAPAPTPANSAEAKTATFRLLAR
jgi:hypothetical protein